MTSKADVDRWRALWLATTCDVPPDANTLIQTAPAMADMLRECMSMIATMPQPRPKWADDLLREWQGEGDDDA